MKINKIFTLIIFCLALASKTIDISAMHDNNNNLEEIQIQQNLTHDILENLDPSNLFEDFRIDNLETIKFFCENNIVTLEELINKKNQNGLTPIFLAFMNDSIKIIKYLYDKDKNIFIKKDKDGSSIITKYLKCAGPKVVAFLQEKNLLATSDKNLTEMENNLKEKPIQQNSTCDIFEAFKTDNLEAVKILCKNDINYDSDITLLKKLLNTKNENGLTLFCIAIYSDSIKIIQFIHKIDPALFKEILIQGENYGDSPIKNAFANKSIKIIQFLYNQYHEKECFKKLLLQKDNNSNQIFLAFRQNSITTIECIHEIDPIFCKELLINRHNNGYNPISLAIKEDNIKVIVILKRIDQNFLKELLIRKDKEGQTPIFFAFQKDLLKIIKFIHRIDPVLFKKLLLQKNQKGYNQIHAAFANESMEIIKFLIQTEPKLFKEIVSQSVIDGLNPFSLAIAGDSIKIIEFFWDENPKFFDDINQITYAFKNDRIKIINLIYNKDKNILIKRDKDGFTLISKCLNVAGPKAKQFILEKKDLIQYTKKLTEKERISHYARHQMWKEAIDFIKNNTINIDHLNFKDENGQTPLILACEADEKDLIQLILEKAKKMGKLGNVINEKDNFGYTPIIWACINKNWPLVEKFLFEYTCEESTIESFAEISDDAKWSCLEIACEDNAPSKIIQKLATPKTVNNLQINVKNKLYKTPLYYACKNKNIEAVKYLLLMGAEIDAKIKEDFLNTKNEILDTKDEIKELLVLTTNLNAEKNKIDFLKHEKNTEFNKLALQLIACQSLKSNNDTITENHLLSKIFNDKEINAQKTLTMGMDLYSFIQKINKELKLKIDIKRYENLKTICTICQCSSDKKETVTLPCHNTHIFCKTCIEKWLKDNITCPNCKTEVTIDFALQNKNWDLAKKLLSDMPKGSINLTQNPDIQYLDAALENNQDEIIRLLLEKNTKQKEINNKLAQDLNNNSKSKVNNSDFTKIIFNTIDKPKKTNNQINQKAPKKKYYFIKVKNDFTSKTHLNKQDDNDDKGWTTADPKDKDALEAMELAKSKPANGFQLKTKMEDRNCNEKNDWKKIIQIFTEYNPPVEIHYALKTTPKENAHGINVYEANFFKFKKYNEQNNKKINNGTFKPVSLDGINN